jgi:hypothetical protein
MAESVAGLTVELKALTTKFEQGFEKAQKTVKRAETNIVKSMGAISIAAKIQLGKDIFNATTAVARGIAELASRGDELDDLTGTFNALGGSAAQIDVAKTALLDTVSTIDLLKVANEGMIRQIPGFAENFGLIADYAGRFAEATGGDAVESLSKLSAALTTAKEKKLADLGVVINQEDAYKKYAAQLGVSAESLDNVQKKTARQVEAINALKIANEELAPVGDSVNAAFAALTTNLNDGINEAAKYIASNEELTAAFRGLSDTIKGIDWEGAGKAASQVFTIFADAAGTVLPYLVQQLKEVAGGFNIIFGQTLTAERDRNAIGLAEKQKQLEKLQESIKTLESGGWKAAFAGIGGQVALPGMKEQAVGLQKAIDIAMSNYNKLNAQIAENEKQAEANRASLEKLRNPIQIIGESAGTASTKISGNAKALSSASKEAEKAAKNIADLKAKWSEFVSGNKEDTLKSQIEEAIDTLNRPKLDGLKAELETILRTDFMNDWKEAIESGAIGFDEVQRAADDFVKQTSDDIEKQFGEAGSNAARALTEELSSTFDVLSNGISEIGAIFGLELQGITSALNRLSDEQKQKILNGLGVNVSSKDAASLIDVASTNLDAIVNAKKRSKESKSEKGTGEAIGAGIGTGIGAVIGGPAGAAIGAAIGKAIGGAIGGMFKWGPQNPETLARKSFGKFIQEGFEKLGAVSFKDAQNRMQTISGKQFDLFMGATTRFNKPGWADEMNKWGEESKATFLGLGESIKQLLGITEDVGGQMAFILGEQLSGNIDNARLLVAQLGLSFNDLEEAMFQAALQGKITFSEFEIGITNAANAFKPGLEAVNDLRGAMDQLVGSGGRGVAALMAVRNAAVEAMEGGARTLEQLGAQMLAQGVDPSLVENFMLALKERSIKTLEELANASDRVAAGIVAELTSNDEALRNQWAQMTQDLKGLAETIESIPREKDIKINVRTEFDKNTQQFISAGGMSVQTGQKAAAFADGGVINGPMAFGYGGGKLGVAGEAGAEAIMPLTRIGGKLGVLAVGGQQSAGNVYHIDARGADIGVERRIRAALMDVEDRAVRRSLNAMGDNSRRGGRF